MGDMIASQSYLTWPNTSMNREVSCMSTRRIVRRNGWQNKSRTPVADDENLQDRDELWAVG